MKNILNKMTNFMKIYFLKENENVKKKEKKQFNK
jgi:hypothetical protein